MVANIKLKLFGILMQTENPNLSPMSRNRRPPGSDKHRLAYIELITTQSTSSELTNGTIVESHNSSVFGIRWPAEGDLYQIKRWMK